MRSWKIPLIWINLTSRTMNDSFWTQCRHVQSTDLLWKDLLLGCKNVTIILEISWLMNYSPNSYRSNWSVSDFERRHVSDFLKKMIIYQIPIYHLYFIKKLICKILVPTFKYERKNLKIKDWFFFGKWTSTRLWSSVSNSTLTLSDIGSGDSGLYGVEPKNPQISNAS